MNDPHITRDIAASLPLLRLAPLLELRFSGQEAALGVISGHASIWAGQPGGVDSYGDQISKGAYSATIAAHAAAGTMPVMLWSHDPARPVGRWTELREDERGLYVRGQLNLQTQAGREAFEHLKARDIGGLSIGFRIAENGFKRQADGSRLLTGIDLHEISLCAMPAARAARVTEIKSAPASRQELFNFLHEAGLSRAASKAIAAGGWSALSGQPDDTEKFEALAKKIETARRELRAFKAPPRYYY